MTLTRAFALFPLFAFLLTPPVAAETPPAAAAERHVRVTDLRLRMLVAQGISDSPTFRALVDRLDASDVVVYITPELYADASFGGRLTLLSAVGGLRYVMVRVAQLHSPIQQLQMIGHELQHAVEIADNPEIVDAESMIEEYLEIGYINGGVGTGLAFETEAATEIAGLVGEELRTASKRSGD